MRSPVTGVVFALELTHRWDALLPVLIGALTAYGASVLLLKRSVLTEKIARRGYHVSREYDVDPLEVLFVGEVMETALVTFDAQLPVRAALSVISSHDPATVAARRQLLYPIVGERNRLLAVLTRTQLETAAHHGDLARPVSELGRTEVIVAHPDQTLRAVATAMAEHAVDRMPVVDRHDPSRILGMISVPMLLAGRLRDLREARDSERVLRLRVVRTRRRRPSRAAA
ncbi:MAG TPA: CBS domain-containing protein, partial [Jatrophihabitans sp.]|nr:CBS domain-containing protein [Jatrophihabitans sp.]